MYSLYGGMEETGNVIYVPFHLGFKEVNKYKQQLHNTNSGMILWVALKKRVYTSPGRP